MEKWQRDVFKALEEQIRYINLSFKDLASCIIAYFEDNHDLLNRLIVKISAAERQASKLKNMAIAEAAAAESSIHRSDYLRLVLLLSEVAGYQGGAAVRLGKTGFQPKKEDLMIPKAKSLIEVFLKMGDILALVSKAMGDDMLKVPALCEEIDRIEEVVDDYYRDLEVHLYSRKDIDIRDIMQLRTVFLHIEEACDIILKVSDSIRIILITH